MTAGNVIYLGMTFVFLVMTAGTVAADTIEVPGVYGPTIQNAIDNANDGDTILVYPGTYTENVDVNKELTIISESGNPDDTIVQAADPNKHVFNVTADNVVISGFSIKDASSGSTAGIYLKGTHDNMISNNILSNNDYGICLWSADNNIFYNNYFNNTDNVAFYGTNTGNIWNINKKTGTNIVGGPYLGGNFWANPDDTGFSQTSIDADGIGDSPYNVDEENIDYLPLK